MYLNVEKYITQITDNNHNLKYFDLLVSMRPKMNSCGLTN